MRCVELVVTGRVQGVFFRKYTKEVANQLGLRGYVRNQKDGSVMITACGTYSDVDKLIKWCHLGSPMSSVTDVEVNESNPVEIQLNEFEIKY
jgi:acylphosphatase